MCSAYIGLTHREFHLRVFFGPVEDSSSCEKNGNQNQFNNNIFSDSISVGLVIKLSGINGLWKDTSVYSLPYRDISQTKQKRLLIHELFPIQE